MVTYLRTPCVCVGVFLLLLAAPLPSRPGGLYVQVHAADPWATFSSSSSPYVVVSGGLGGMTEQQPEGLMGTSVDLPGSLLPAEPERPGAAAAQPAVGQPTRARGGMSGFTKKAIALATAVALLLGAAVGGTRLLRREEKTPTVLAKHVLLEKLKSMVASAQRLASTVGTREAARRSKEAKGHLDAAGKQLEAEPDAEPEEKLRRKILENLVKAEGALVGLQGAGRAEGARAVQQTTPIMTCERWPETIWDTAAENDFVKGSMLLLDSYELASRSAAAHALAVGQALAETPDVQSLEDRSRLECMVVDLERLKSLHASSLHLLELHTRLRSSLSSALRVISVEEREENAAVATLQLDMLGALCRDLQDSDGFEEGTKATLKKVVPVFEQALHQMLEYSSQQAEATSQLEACTSPLQVEKRTISAADIESQLASLIDSLWDTVSVVGKFEEVRLAPFLHMQAVLKSHRDAAAKEATDNRFKLLTRIAELEELMVKSVGEGAVPLAPSVYRSSLKALKELVDIDEDATEVPELPRRAPAFSLVEDLSAEEVRAHKAIMTALHMRRVLSELQLIRVEIEVYLQLKEDVEATREVMQRAEEYSFVAGSPEELRAQRLVADFQNLWAKLSRGRTDALLRGVAGGDATWRAGLLKASTVKEELLSRPCEQQQRAAAARKGGSTAPQRRGSEEDKRQLPVLCLPRSCCRAAGLQQVVGTPLMGLLRPRGV
ncbi:hypothetical protein Esti_000846 [Eimeria stiedai]